MAGISVEESTSAAVTAPPSPIEESPGAVTTLEGPATPKDGRRKRLMSRIQRISSSPTLAQLGRSRSNAPYGNRGSLSCVSLAAAGPPAQYTPGPSSSSDYFSYSSSTNPGTPTIEFPSYDGIESRLAIRKVENASTSGSIGLPAELTTRSRSSTTALKPPYDFWVNMPDEIRVYIFAFLLPKELVRASRVNKEWHSYCFDGQLWTRFDASDFHQDIPAESLAKIIVAAGPFVKDLNLRGCVQVEHFKRAEVVAKACRNLINATLEGCRNFQKTALHSLIKANGKLANLNLTGLPAVSNTTCEIIAKHCPQLETFNVSWCKHMDARGIRMVVSGCPKLKDIRAGEIRGFDNLDVAKAIFETNNLERLVLNGCADLTDEALKIMIHGVDPKIDILTDRPTVPPRKLRHLNLSRCRHLTSEGVRAMGYLVPDLEGLQLSGCTALTDSALEPVLASTPRLTHLELEDLLELTNDLFSHHLAKAPCAPQLKHLSVSYCENLSDTGLLPVIKSCVSLTSLEMDNTRIGDLVLSEAAAMVRSRGSRTHCRDSRPHIGLRLVVYDCQMVTWTGIREVLSWNAEIRQPQHGNNEATYPTEVIGMKCFYGWQQTVDQHTQRVLRGDFAAAGRLERKWADYMQAVEEAGASGAGYRRRRRRAREAQMLHADEEEGGAGTGGRRRARTVASSCAIM